MLASDLHALGDFGAARRVLGDTHPLTLRAAVNLAAVRHALGEEPGQ